MKKLKRISLATLVLVMVLSAVLAIPASASTIARDFSRPNCGCSLTFGGEYGGGKYDVDRGTAWAEVEHDCESAYAYVSMKCWIAPYSSLNNYTSRTFTGSARDNGFRGGVNGSEVGKALVEIYQLYDDTPYALLGVENYYKVSVKHNGVEYASQAWSSDGDIPLSYNPPVVTE